MTIYREAARDLHPGRSEFTPTILIVDDDLDGRETLGVLLHDQGYTLAFAAAGGEALVVAAELSPDLILLDVVMPGMDGLEVCRRLRANPALAEVPIILVTAHDDHIARLQGLEAGADDFLPKLFDPTELRARVRTITRLNRYRRLLRERAKFERVVEFSPNGLLLVAVDGTIRLANPALLRLLGADQADALVGQNLLALVAPKQVDLWVAQLRVAIDNPAYIARIETVLIRQDHTTFPAEVDIGHFVGDDAPLAQIIVRDVTERKRAEEAVRQYTQRLQMLHTIDQAILAAQSPEAIVQIALDNICAVVPCWWASLVMFDSDSDAIKVLVGHADDPVAPDIGAIQTLGSEQIAVTLRQGEVQVVDDSALLTAPRAVVAPVPSTYLRSYVNVPLIDADDLLGVLTLGAERARAFAPEHIAIAREVANQIAVAIRQARLYAAERRMRQTAETLRAASLALTQTLDLDTVLDTLLEYLGQLVPYDGACAVLYTADAHLVVRSVRGVVRWGDLMLSRDLVLDAEASPHLRALLATQASILIADTSAGPFWEGERATAERRSWLGVPLIAAGVVIGLYAMDKQQPGYFTDEHRQIAESLAAQAAVATQNARLFAEVSAGRERLQMLSRRLVEVQETERAQIARELHDEIGQVLTGLNLVLQVNPQILPETLMARLGSAQALVNDLITRVRELSLDLRPAMLDDLGLLPALLWHVKRYTAQTQVQVTVKHIGIEHRVSAELETAAYRIVQEALTNIARHAGVQAATVRLWISGEVLGVQVEDQGCGFDPEAMLAAHQSSGLAGMVERARLLGGYVTIESAPGQGTRLTAELPLGPPIERRRTLR